MLLAWAFWPRIGTRRYNRYTLFRSWSTPSPSGHVVVLGSTWKGPGLTERRSMHLAWQGSGCSRIRNCNAMLMWNILKFFTILTWLIASQHSSWAWCVVPQWTTRSIWCWWMLRSLLCWQMCADALTVRISERQQRRLSTRSERFATLCWPRLRVLGSQINAYCRKQQKPRLSSRKIFNKRKPT